MVKEGGRLPTNGEGGLVETFKGINQKQISMFAPLAHIHAFKVRGDRRSLWVILARAAGNKQILSHTRTVGRIVSVSQRQ